MTFSKGAAATVVLVCLLSRADVGTAFVVRNESQRREKYEMQHLYQQGWSTSIRSPTRLYDLKKLEWKTPTEEETEEWLRTYGERSRRARRDVFTSADWIKSRRPDRWTRVVLTTFDSSLTQLVFKQVTVLALIATFCIVYNNAVYAGFDFGGVHYDPMLPLGLLPPLTLPLDPFSLCVGALGLLLTFRTNVSYGRWNEARTAWGKVINDSRSIARMACIWSKSYKDMDDATLQRLGEAICSFSRALMNRTLPPQEDAEKFKKYCLERLSDQKYAQVLLNAKHRPTCALAEITNILIQMELNPLHQVEVERIISGLCDALGASERIFTSPVPTFYPRFTERFLAWWLMFLPFGLYNALGMTWNHLGVLPTTIVLSAFLLGIEELATEMEEPFSILPMEKMCEGSIRVSVMEQVSRSQKGIQSGFYNDGWAPETLKPQGAPTHTATTTTPTATTTTTKPVPLVPPVAPSVAVALSAESIPITPKTAPAATTPTTPKTAAEPTPKTPPPPGVGDGTISSFEAFLRTSTTATTTKPTPVVPPVPASETVSLPAEYTPTTPKTTTTMAATAPTTPKTTAEPATAPTTPKTTTAADQATKTPPPPGVGDGTISSLEAFLRSMKSSAL